MNQPYLSFLLLLAFVAFNAGALIGMSHLLAPRKPTPVKETPYESGMPPLGDAHERFSVKFYLVAMLFIIFDNYAMVQGIDTVVPVDAHAPMEITHLGCGI